MSIFLSLIIFLNNSLIMKKIFTLLSFIACTASTAFAQVIDGNMNDVIYTFSSSKLNANDCFTDKTSAATILATTLDVKAIKIGKDASNIYIGVVCKIRDGNDNAVALMLNFSGLTGAAAGTNLATVGAGNYMSHNFAADFEVDYLFALNAGNTGQPCYVNVVKKVGTTVVDYLENLGQSGFEFPNLRGYDNMIFPAPGVNLAFSNVGSATSGFEMKIPYAAIGLSPSANISVQAFAAVVASSGYFSNVTVPGNVTLASGCLGTDGLGGGDGASTMNFNTLPTTSGTGPFHTSTFVIPVEMTNFDATAAQNTVKLNWLTASEKNNGYFDIERSANGRDWSKIGQVKGNGTTSAVHKYAFVDESPLATVNYYRLKQVDFDNNASYSSTVSVNLKSGGKSFSVYPNPANDRLNLVSDRFDTEGSLEIYDLSGRLVQSGKSTSNTLDISRLNAGLYQLRLLDKTGATVNQARFSKN
jgi:hypothetical protein